MNTRWLPLSLADQNRVREIWPRVRLGCQAIKTLDKNGDAGNWTPEHIRAQLDLSFQGRSTAQLWQIMSREGAMIGFLVTIVGNCPYLNVPQSLIVWVAYTFQRIPGKSARMVLTQLEEQARAMGLKYVDGYAGGGKFGWLRWLDRYGKGYKAAQFLFRKDVWRD